MESAKPRREICVTGVTTTTQMVQVAGEFVRACGQHSRLGTTGAENVLVLGVLASSQTLKGQTSRWSNQYPERFELRGLFRFSGYTADARLHLNVDDPAELIAEVARANELCDGEIPSMQLNVCWPSPEVVQRLSDQFPGMELVLQIGANALHEFTFPHDGAQPFYEVSGLVDRVAGYGSTISRIVLKPGGSLNRLRSVDADRLLPVVEALAAELPNLGIGVACGLCAETLPTIAPLARACPTLSFDAQGRLRDPCTDELDLNKVNQYFTAAFDLFSSMRE